MQTEASQRWWEGLPPAVGAKPRVSHALPELPLHPRLGAPLQPTCTHAPPTALHPLLVLPCLSVPLPTSVSASLQLSVPSPSRLSAVSLAASLPTSQLRSPLSSPS